jgi:ribosomal protein S18 acetylase RimI-like enzyme
MQRTANAGWPARDTEPLGDWLLRAHAGITGRANSVMAVGDPGVGLDEALLRIERWYAERALAPLLQLPEPDERNAELERRGWKQLHVTLVQTASVEATLAQLPERPDLRQTVLRRPDGRWLSLMHDLDREDPESHLAILTGPEVVAFVTLLDAEEPVGIGRVSIEGQWAGITSVDVAPDRRREGIGSAVMRALLQWASAEGARAAYLQVRAHNASALALYQRLGFLTHHPYCYRAPR